MLEKDLKITRSEYLNGKTALTDEDIINLLDLPPEKESRKDLKSYTDKNYSDFENDEASLQRLTENLINNSDYLLYRGSYIAKSKLLYEQSVTLCNEIPSLVIGQEIKESFYLLPYGYAKDNNQKLKKFADALDENAFTDIKRLYGTNIKNTYKKSKEQGKNVFYIISATDLSLSQSRGKLGFLINNDVKQGRDPSGKYYLYSENESSLIYLEVDKDGFFREERKFDLKKLRSVISNRPFSMRGQANTALTGTFNTLNDTNESVNTFFNSLLLRGEVEMIRSHKELQKYDLKYLNCLEALKQITNQTQSELLQNSNRLFIQSEIESEFYKDLIKEKKRNVALIGKNSEKDLVPGQKIAQSSTQEAMFSSPESTQFPITELNHWKNTINIKNNQIKIIKRLSKIRTEKIEPKEFLRKLKEVFGSNDFEHSTYIENQIKNKKNILRISSHSINSFYARKKIKENSIVIKLSEHDFVDHKDRLVKEYVYFPKNLTKEVKDNIINGLSDWVNIGIYTYEKADRINMTSDFEKKEKERNVALIGKITRSEYLNGKTALTDEDIISLLDLPPEKVAANIETYTEKSYKELKENPEELARLTKELTSAKYLRYKETFISKSKLLYEQSSVLYNEIPCLIVLNEMKIPAYLLPYEYAKNKQGDTRHFADSLKENAFTDFKRVFNTKIRHSFENGMEQGRDIFFLVNNEKLDKEEIKKQLEKLIKFHKGPDKQGLFLFYSEKDYKCFSFESDYSGKITENNDYELKKLRLAISDKPFTPNLERTNTNERPRSDKYNIAPTDLSVNELFYSLLKRGEITALATLKDLSDRENRYYEAISDMERTNNTIFSDFLKKSNTAFLLKEKQSRFYKDIFKLIPQGERTMEKEKIEVQTYKFQNGETIDEILSKQTSWATDEGCLDNMIDSSLREVADFADEKEYELLKRISIVKNNPEVDLKLLAVQTDAAARYMAAKHYDDRLADIGKRPFSKDFINPYAQDDFPYELPSWMKNHLEEYPNQNVPEHTSEEEKAYQEWEEMLDDNQKAEEIIEKNHQREPVSLNPEESLDDNQREEEQGKEDFEEYIHSSEFIDKFGDWEKAARINKLMQADTISKDGKVIIEGEDVTEEINQLRNEKDSKILRIFAKDIGRIVKGTYHNNDSNIDVTLSMSNIDEIKNHHMAMSGHLEAIQYIPEIIQKGIFIAEEPNEDKAKHPNIEKYKYFVCGLNIGEIDFTCKSAIGVDKDGNHYYDQRLSQIEKGLLIDNLSQLMSRGKPEKSLLKYDKRLLRICQCPQSLYLDENLLPTKETVEAVKGGKLYLEKDSEVFQLLHDERTNQIVGKELSDAIQKMPEQLIFASTGIGQMVERLTGKQLGTVNPTRENEIFAPPITTISQNTENSINYHGLTLTKKDNNLIEPAYDVLLISGIDDKTDSKLIEMLDNTAKWDQYCVLNKSENYVPAIAAEIVAKEKEIKNENVNKSFIEKVQDLKAKVSKSLKKNVAVGVALTSVLSANPNLFAQEKPVKLPSEQTILKEAAKEKENLLKIYKDKSPEELLKLLLEANEEKTAAKIQASNLENTVKELEVKNTKLENTVKELEVKNTKLEFYKEHYKTKSATQESFYDEMKKTQDMYESLKRSSQQDHDILYKHAKIVVNGQERVCHTGLVDGFKNCVTRLDKNLKLNKELVKENNELRKIINQSNQNERNGVSY